MTECVTNARPTFAGFAAYQLQYPELRTGQAFMNYFKITRHDPKLFYTTKDSEAWDIIETHYSYFLD